jgi:hypothetical protein
MHYFFNNMGEDNLQIIESYSQGGGNTNTITTDGTQTGTVEKVQSIPRRKAVTRPMRIILICKEMIAYERIAMMQISSYAIISLQIRMIRIGLVTAFRRGID